MNLGSRLEGLNKVYGTDILVGENTVRLVEHAFMLRELDMVRVKGRTQVVRIYELIGKAGTLLASDHEQALGLYAEALEAYRKGMWVDALAILRQALTLRPDDGPSRTLTLTLRCVEYEAKPPEPWDGVFDQQVK